MGTGGGGTGGGGTGGTGGGGGGAAFPLPVLRSLVSRVDESLLHNSVGGSSGGIGSSGSGASAGAGTSSGNSAGSSLTSRGNGNGNTSSGISIIGTNNSDVLLERWNALIKTAFPSSGSDARAKNAAIEKVGQSYGPVSLRYACHIQIYLPR